MTTYKEDIALAEAYLWKRQSSKDRGIPFELTLSQFKALGRRKKCQYTSIPFDAKTVWFKRTIDRIDSTKGYIPGNVVAVCYFANNFKSQWENDSHGNPMTLELAAKIINSVKKVTK